MTELMVAFRYSANASKTPAGRSTDSWASGAEDYGALRGQTLDFNKQQLLVVCSRCYHASRLYACLHLYPAQSSLMSCISFIMNDIAHDW